MVTKARKDGERKEAKEHKIKDENKIENDLAVDPTPKDFLCPITHDLMKDPVVAGDGQSYERAAIEHWLTRKRTSPMTGAPLPHTNLIPNVRLKSIIDDFIQKLPKNKQEQKDRADLAAQIQQREKFIAELLKNQDMQVKTLEAEREKRRELEIKLSYIEQCVAVLKEEKQIEQSSFSSSPPEIKQPLVTVDLQVDSPISFFTAPIRTPMVKKESKERKTESCFLFEKGLVQLRKLAAENDVDAQAHLAKLYLQGIGTSPDRAEAGKWFLVASRHLDKPAGLWALGHGHSLGIGMAKDPKKAFECWQKAADQRYAPAQNSLGDCFLEGQGTAKDAKEGVKCYHLAAEQGLAEAQFNLSVCYEGGIGVPKNKAEALRLLRLAANNGDRIAQNNLAQRHLKGDGVAKDTTEAVKWFRLSAKQGYAIAQFNLGLCCQEGKGTVKDLSEAMTWFRLSAEQGCIFAEYNLGMCLVDGLGVAKDEKEGIVWLLLAAEKNYAPAQSCLAACYLEGTGVRRDEREGYRLFHLAAEQGYPPAIEALRTFSSAITFRC